ncbi:DMT family transporter [Microvirga subterranea]|uniref:EamA domain-containing membrane protein RarD n=1 Tax=Microvirga subterranea TaxID=186651 RepID=A0A370HW89_9HYPH|nr:EamA family transporter [Microvirga subterranea]RDI62560.1 EamA domain-containing membrane protein RarD [Microvirga subterranea]
MTSTIHKTMTASDWALLTILSVVWGGSFLFIGVAVKELPPLTIVALRVAMGALALRLILVVMGVPMPREREAWVAFLGMGILNNVIPFTLIVWGQKHIASGLASILNATTPLFTVIVAHYLTADERLTRQRFAGVVVGFLGVAVMIGGAALQSWNLAVPAQLAVLAAAVSYAFSGVYGRRFKAMGIPPLATAAGQVTASSAVLLPLALLVDHPWALPLPSTGTVASMLGLALLSTAFAYTLFFRLLGRAGATNVGLVTFLIPVSAILLGVLVLGETLEPRHMAGMALIGAGLILIDGRLVARIARAFSSRKPALRGSD